MCVYFGTVTAQAQIAETDFRRILSSEAGLTSSELSSLDNGEIVAKSLPTADKQELSTVGIVRISDLPAVAMPVFREALSQKGDDSMKAGGRFGSPPIIDDLQTLKLEDDEFGQLVKCSVGNCDMNMSAETIRKFQEIDWNAADHRERATRAFGEMLLGYVLAYTARGNAALGRYDNRRKTVDLAASHRLLLANSLFVKDISPEFFDYLKNFPNANVSNVESSMHWAVVDFGLKPSVTLSHSAAHVKQIGTENQLIVASKQFYSSRYLDSSLTLWFLLRVSAGNSVDTYLILADRSRSDALEGPLGGFSRSVVQKESLERIKGVLEKTHIRLLTATRPTPTETRSETAFLDRIVERAGTLGLLIAAGSVIIALLVFLFWRKRKVSESPTKNS